MRALLPLLLALGACLPKDAQVVDEPSWKTESGQERIRLQLIQSLIDRGNAREALVLIRTAREHGDEDPDLDLYQAAAYMGTGLPEEATRLLSQYVEEHPRDPRPWRRLGVLHADARRLEASASAFARATELDDSHADTYNNLGFVLMALDRGEEAVEALRQAIDLDGTNLRYRNNLGFALATAGRYGEALEAFLSGARPADAHANMALAFERAGDDNAAAEQYEMALTIDPHHETSKEALARLSFPTETLP